MRTKKGGRFPRLPHPGVNLVQSTVFRQGVSAAFHFSMDPRSTSRFIEAALDNLLEELDVANHLDVAQEILAEAYAVIGWHDEGHRLNVFQDRSWHDYLMLHEYERTLHSILTRERVPERIPEALSGRSETVFAQIGEYLQGRTVLDLGSGDGAIGARISQEGFEVELADVYRHSNVDSIGLTFHQFEQGQQVPTNKQYDNVLLLTVLHHCDDPEATLRDAKRMLAPGGRVVVIESVYSVDPAHFGDIYEETWPLSDKAREMTDWFKSLTNNEQFDVNVFFDHFYNRGIHYSEALEDKVNIPFNFCTPQMWPGVFERNGLRQIELRYLGIDQPIVPEYHTLHILEAA